MNQPEIQKECKGTERLVGTGLKWREGEGGDWTERDKKMEIKAEDTRHLQKETEAERQIHKRWEI